MYSKTLRGTRYYDLESKSSLELKYYIVEKVISSGECYYGVEIEESKIGEEIKACMNVEQLLLSESKDCVEELLSKLIGGGVTLVTMDCVIDELMAS